MENRIQVKRMETPDENVRIYASRVRLTEAPLESGIKGQLDIGPVLDAILDIPGVGVAQVYAYYVVVGKCPVYSWEEIEVSILRLFTALNLDLTTLDTEVK